MAVRYDVVVVGAGIVGLAVTRRLLIRDPSTRVLLVEKEADVGLHQSSHNSGVLHAGVYYAPGSRKAVLCRAGKQEMEAFCAEQGIPVRRSGKVVVAVRDDELPRLRSLLDRARRNGVPGVREIGPAELAEIEPAVRGVGALHSPTTAVVDFGQVCRALAADVRARGAELAVRSEVGSIQEGARGVRVQTTAGEVAAGAVVGCAGLQADRLLAAAGATGDLRVVPFRGSWHVLRPEASHLCRGNVYPVPDPRLPFLGVHLTRRVDGEVWVGPNAVLAMGREAYRRGMVRPADLADAVRFPGTWRLARRHLRSGVAEAWRDLVPAAYVRLVREYVPALAAGDFARRECGIRAQVVRRDGTLVDDFVVHATRRTVHVVNAPSPGATSALAIASLVVNEVDRHR